MKNFDKLQEIAELEGLRAVTTTAVSNGYPQDLNAALIGFEDMKHLEYVKKRYTLVTAELHKRDGWDLWAVDEVDSFFTSPFTSDDMLEEDEAELNYDWIKNELPYKIKETKDINELQELCELTAEILNELKELNDNEVLVFNGKNTRVLLKESMNLIDDGMHKTIGLVIKE